MEERIPDTNCEVGWIEKAWGRTKKIYDEHGKEVWIGQAKEGTRTSLHRHDHHEQSLVVLDGSVAVDTQEWLHEVEIVQSGKNHVINPGIPHRLTFVTDCEFLEIYQAVGEFGDDSPTPSVVEDTHRL